jgi:hypothetical protein
MQYSTEFKAESSPILAPTVTASSPPNAMCVPAITDSLKMVSGDDAAFFSPVQRISKRAELDEY